MTSTVETPHKLKLWEKLFLAVALPFVGFHAAMTVVLASAATAAHYGVMNYIDILHPLFGA